MRIVNAARRFSATSKLAADRTNVLLGLESDENRCWHLTRAVTCDIVLGIMSDHLIERALELLANEELLLNARKGAPVCITAAGYLLSLESGASRWAAERAVKAALRRLDNAAGISEKD